MDPTALRAIPKQRYFLELVTIDGKHEVEVTKTQFLDYAKALGILSEDETEPRSNRFECGPLTGIVRQ